MQPIGHIGVPHKYPEFCELSKGESHCVWLLNHDVLKTSPQVGGNGRT